ncbi:MAG: hypothetical protein OQK12_04490 [Motiliproteus sp.]|nr:hypothetical protein [Motiliproteus sp.]MCW9051476.1 hypothetical protein [Motiliproteus sp.]
MATFKFLAKSKRTQEQLPIEVFLAGQSLGFAPTEKGQYLEVVVNDCSAPLPWYAMIWNIRIAKGESMGGTFELEVDEKLASAELNEMD